MKASGSDSTLEQRASTGPKHEDQSTSRINQEGVATSDFEGTPEQSTFKPPNHEDQPTSKMDQEGVCN